MACAISSPSSTPGGAVGAIGLASPALIPTRVYHYRDPAAVILGLRELRKKGLTPRGLLFVALDPRGNIREIYSLAFFNEKQALIDIQALAAEAGGTAAR